MKNLILLALLGTPALAQNAEPTFATESRPTRGGAHETPKWDLLNSKRAVIPQGRRCHCGEEGELLGYNCSKHYLCLKK